MFSIKQELIHSGKIIYELGLIDSHSGNMSVRINDTMLVTASGVKLGYLTYDGLVEFNINLSIPQAASSETAVHRSIYQNTEYNAIIHTHSFYSLLLSFYYDEIVPEDSEGLFFNPCVPVLDCGAVTVGSACVEQNISDFLTGSRVVILKGHGVFSAGKDLDEALKHLSSLENSCRLIHHKNNLEQIGRRS